jgi:hypothetical protein
MHLIRQTLAPSTETWWMLGWNSFDERSQLTPTHPPRHSRDPRTTLLRRRPRAYDNSAKDGSHANGVDERDWPSDRDPPNHEPSESSKAVGQQQHECDWVAQRRKPESEWHVHRNRRRLE